MGRGEPDGQLCPTALTPVTPPSMQHSRLNLVFDFGGVLFGWQPAQLVAATFPQTVTDAEGARGLAHAIFGHADWHAFDAGRLTLTQVVQNTAQRLALPQQPLLALVKSIGARLEPIADSVAILQTLVALRTQGSNVRLYYLSNMPRPYARTLEQRHTFLQWFDGGIFSGDVHIIKPDPAIYQLLENRYTLEPDRTIFVDDLHINVRSAQTRGWHGIEFASAAQLRAALQPYLQWPASS